MTSIATTVPGSALELAGRERSKHTPVKVIPRNPGVQYTFEFENGYGASLLVDTFAAYGGLELAVMVDGHCYYDTPITDDVLGYLQPDEVEGILDAIKALPPRMAAISA